MLCIACDNFVTSVIQQDFTTWSYKDYGPNGSFEFAHGDYESVRKSVSAGCQFCAYFEPAFKLLPHHCLQGNGSECRIICTFHKSDSDRFKSTFDYWASSIGGLYTSQRPFEISQSPNGAQKRAMLKSRGKSLPFQPFDRPDLPLCIELARFWIEQCEHAHDNCLRPKNSTLPTRVIDVGSRDGSENPKLFVTNKCTGRYIVLSYCWGRDGHTVTSTLNILEHQKGIELQYLPKTLRDAISVTRLLGFRYLWVDALCIVQDDPEDWRREAANMCFIYEKAVLSLAILDSKSSDTGFLHPREAPHIIVQRKGVELGIGPLLSQAQHRIPGSQLETRAWTLQERVLAPASLHFGSDQLYWECCAGLASEAYPEVREERESASDSYYGRSVHDMKMLLRNETRAESVDIWYFLVEEYTKRHLTQLTDRLPAIEGLAKKFRGRINGDYICGIWTQDLHIGVLWSVSSDRGLSAERTQTHNPTAPSWSWASLDVPVMFNYKSVTHTGDPTVPRIVLKRIENSEELQQGYALEQTVCLHIEGLYQEGICRTSYKRSRSCEFITGTSHSLLDNIKCTLDFVSDEAHVQAGTVIENKYHCLLVAKRQGEYWTKYFFLILERVGEDQRCSTPLPIFKRAGVGWQEVLHESGVLADATRGEVVLI